MDNKIYLIIPSEKNEDAYMDMLDEWEASGDGIYPGAIRRKGRDYLTWLNYVRSISNKDTCPQSLATSDTHFLVNGQGRILGAISIRHYLNENLLLTGGHIGYGVRPTERKKGYAKYMLKQALEKCREMNINRVLVTCNKDNIASAKTIIANGGILENEVVEEDGNIVERYWIKI